MRRHNKLLCIMTNDFDTHLEFWQSILPRMTPCVTDVPSLPATYQVISPGPERGMSCYHIWSVMSCYICHGLSQQWRCSVVFITVSVCKQAAVRKRQHWSYSELWDIGKTAQGETPFVKSLRSHQFYTLWGFQHNK